jgi:hypothetical protein
MNKERNFSSTSNKPNRFLKFPHYSDIFKEDEPPIETLFFNGPIDTYILYLSSLNDEIFFGNLREASLTSIRKLTSRLGDNLRVQILYNYFHGNEGKEFDVVFGVKSVTDLIIYLLSNCNLDSNENDSTSEDELNLLKAILIFNRISYSNKFDNKAHLFKTINEQSHTKLIKPFFPIYFSQIQFNLFPEFHYLSYKTFTIVNELKQNNLLKDLILEFINQNGFVDFKEWIGQYLSIIHYWYHRKNGEPVDKISISLKKEYLDSHTFSLTDDGLPKLASKQNYEIFIKKSFYKSAFLDRPILINYYFLFKLFDNEIYFKLREYIESNQIKQPDSNKSIALKSIFGKDIIENKFFKGIMKNFLDIRKYKIEEIESKKRISEPDLYVTKNKYHLIFELKDSLIDSQTIEKCNIEEIYDNLKRNYANVSDKKGVVQLANFIKYLFPKISEHNITIFPILVVTEEITKCTGYRDLINNLFWEEFKNISIPSKVVIKGMALINLRTLFNLSVSNKKFDMVEILTKYHEKVAVQIKKVNKLGTIESASSFSDNFEDLTGLNETKFGYNQNQNKQLVQQLEISNWIDEFEIKI